MRKKFGMAIVAALLAVPVAVHAQGIFGGMERGAAEGSAAAGPGGAGGGVNGLLGINPGPRYHRHWVYEHRSAYRHHRHHRYYY